MSDRLVAIMGGGDWYDASVNFLVVPENVNLDEAKAAYNLWYQEEYCPSLHRNEHPEFFTFPQWLIKNHGARDGDDQLEIYEE